MYKTWGEIIEEAKAEDMNKNVQIVKRIFRGDVFRGETVIFEGTKGNAITRMEADENIFWKKLRAVRHIKDDANTEQIGFQSWDDLDNKVTYLIQETEE